MINKDELHLTCSCLGHELHIEKDDTEKMWYASFWERGHQSTPPWRYQLRLIWFILRNGHAFADDIVLEEKQMLELKRYVDSQVPDKLP